MAKGKTYDEDFKKTIVELYNNKKPASEIVREYGISNSVLYKWIKEYSPIKTEDGTVTNNKEIPTLPKLLERINIKNNIIVFDALNTQKETIEYIFNHDGYYVAPIKGNHKILYEELNDYFNDKEFYDKVIKENYVETIEKRNGEAEIREYGFTNDVDWIYNKNEWIGLKSVGFAKRTYKNSQNKIVSDIRFYISNLSATFIDIISKSIRSEWAIENNLHYFLDMVFKEDSSTAFIQNTQKNLNIIRKFALALLKNYKEKTKLSMNSIRFLLNTNFEKEISQILSV